jgi:hypothetical protein
VDPGFSYLCTLCRWADLFFSVKHAEVPPPFDWTLDFYLYLFFANLQKTTKILVPQIANPLIATLAEAPQIATLAEAPQI